jgi:hydrogenase maturation protease
MKRILIAGIGNRLMGDDGFGPRVTDLLMSIDLPPDVEVRDMGTAGLTIATDLADYDKVIFLDSTEMDKPFGELTKIRLEIDSDEDITDLARLTLHEVGLEGLLKFSKAIGTLPEDIILIGCNPKNLHPSLTLSDEVESALNEAVSCILKLLNNEKN